MVGIYDVSKWGKGHYHSRRTTQLQDQSSKKLSIHVISDGITRLPILEGEISHIELPRGNSLLGLTIVGGADTPLRCVVVQEVFPEGFVALDGRLQPGDQIIEVDGQDMTTATHQQVCEALRKSSHVLKLGVYRERIEAYKSSPPSSVVSSASSSDSCRSNPFTFFNEDPSYCRREGYIYVPSSQRLQPNLDETTYEVALHRQTGKHLGIKLGGKRSEPGVFIVELMPNSIAEQDERILPHDRLLYINGEDVRYSRPEYASKLIQQSKEIVHLIVCRNTNLTAIPNAMCSSPRGRNSSLSQDSLFGFEPEDRSSSGISASSCSDRVSECSSSANIDEDAGIGLGSSGNNSGFSSDSCSRSDQQSRRASPLLSSKEPINNPSASENISSALVDPKTTVITSYSQSEPNGSSPRFYESFRSSQERLKLRDKWPTVSTTHDIKKNSVAESFSHVFGWKREEHENVLQQKHVILNKAVNEGLGMRIGGGVNSNEGDTPIYVANINLQGPAGKSRQIKKGDLVLSVNSHSLLGLTHSQAVAMLKSTSEIPNVTLTLLEGPETSGPGVSNFVPSWLYWQRLPRSLHISKGVILHRIPGSSLGFSIVGGNDPQRGSEPIHVLFVVATSPAALDGRLRCGDRLLAVDGQCLDGVSHATAVCLLKQAGHRVSLEVVSWMGTEL